MTNKPEVKQMTWRLDSAGQRHAAERGLLGLTAEDGSTVLELREQWQARVLAL